MNTSRRLILWQFFPVLYYDYAYFLAKKQRFGSLSQVIIFRTCLGLCSSTSQRSGCLPSKYRLSSFCGNRAFQSSPFENYFGYDIMIHKLLENRQLSQFYKSLISKNKAAKGLDSWVVGCLYIIPQYYLPQIPITKST